MPISRRKPPPPPAKKLTRRRRRGKVIRAPPPPTKIGTNAAADYAWVGTVPLFARISL